MSVELHDILKAYGFKLPLVIEQVDKKSVWQINGRYILKKNDEEEKDIEKVLMINKFLKKEGIPVAEHIKTVSGQYYIVFNNDIYSLTHKMKGEHIPYDNPFSGDYKNTARSIGIEAARLHNALKNLGNTVVYKSDLIGELKTQLSEIKAGNIYIPCEIINFCLSFDRVYYLLPKQLIHRDMQFGNMFFENGKLTGFLDFDSSQVNARLFDIAYFGQSILFSNDYNDSKFVTQWVEFFGAFLSAYHSENALCENEIKSIHKMCIILQTGFISYYLYAEEKRGLIPRRVDMMKWIYFNEPIFNFSL